MVSPSIGTAEYCHELRRSTLFWPNKIKLSIHVVSVPTEWGIFASPPIGWNPSCALSWRPRPRPSSLRARQSEKTKQERRSSVNLHSFCIYSWHASVSSQHESVNQALIGQLMALIR